MAVTVPSPDRNFLRQEAEKAEIPVHRKSPFRQSSGSNFQNGDDALGSAMHDNVTCTLLHG
jgi:hypothetical protein